MTHVSGVLKLLYHQPRPYWVSDGVRAYKCSKDYGFPSGHSSISMHVTVFMILDIFASSIYSSEILIQIITVILSMAFPVLIGFSRVYLGVHSFDQVLNGWLLGLWCALFAHFMLRNQIMSHVEKLINNYSVQNISGSEFI